MRRPSVPGWTSTLWLWTGRLESQLLASRGQFTGLGNSQPLAGFVPVALHCVPSLTPAGGG